MKKKLTKIILEKKLKTNHKKREKNHVGKHGSNPQYFKEKKLQN
jgi:hypothetical protein